MQIAKAKTYVSFGRISREVEPDLAGDDVQRLVSSLSLFIPCSKTTGIQALAAYAVLSTPHSIRAAFCGGVPVVEVISDWPEGGRLLDASCSAQAAPGEVGLRISAGLALQPPRSKVRLVVANFSEPGFGTEKGPVLRDLDLLLKPPRTALSVSLSHCSLRRRDFANQVKSMVVPAQLFLAATAPGSQDGRTPSTRFTSC